MKHPPEKYHRFYEFVGLFCVYEDYISIKYYGYNDSWLIRNLYTNDISTKDISILGKIYKKEIRHQL